MGILRVQMESAGLAGVEPSFIYLYTDDTRSQVKVAGYLDQLIDQGIQLSQRMTALVMLQGSAISDQKNGIFNVRKSGGKWSLVEIAEASPASWIFAGGNTGDGILGTDGKIDMEAYDVNNGQITISAGNELRLRGWPVPGPSGADFIVENFAVSTIHGAAVNIANLGSTSLVMGSPTCIGAWNGSTIAITAASSVSIVASTAININSAPGTLPVITVGNGQANSVVNLNSATLNLIGGNIILNNAWGLRMGGIQRLTGGNLPFGRAFCEPLFISYAPGFEGVICAN